MKYLYLMRHGQTMFNQQQRIQGWVDSPLTELGCHQALEMGARVKADLAERGISFDHYFCSTAERTSDTLELVCEALNGEGAPLPAYERNRGLKEMYFGKLEAQPEILAEPDPEKCRTYYLQFGGESSDTVLERMVSTLTQIMSRPECKNVLAVGHGGANFNFLRGLQDPTEELAKGWGNCLTCIYEFDETRANERPDGQGTGPFKLVKVLRLTD